MGAWRHSQIIRPEGIDSRVASQQARRSVQSQEDGLMKRTVEKWVAWLDRPHDHARKKILTAKVLVLETDKQFRVVKGEADYQEYHRILGYRTNINKSSNNVLFDTELEALQNLSYMLGETEHRATQFANEAQENLYLISEALAN